MRVLQDAILYAGLSNLVAAAESQWLRDWLRHNFISIIETEEGRQIIAQATKYRKGSAELNDLFDQIFEMMTDFKDIDPEVNA